MWNTKRLFVRCTVGLILALGVAWPSVSAQGLPQPTEHHARNRSYDVQHYRLNLQFDFQRKTVMGEDTITLQPLASDFRSFNLDAADMKIKRVTLASGQALTFRVWPQQLTVDLDRPYRRGETITVTIAYESTPRVGLYFIGPDEGYPNKRVQIWSQGECQDNHHWFPCYDFPNDKATSEVIATVPDRYTVISNGRLVRLRENKKSHTKTFHWKQDKPHSSYLISIVVGEFARLLDHYGHLPVEYYVYSTLRDDARRSFEKTPDMITFFSQKIGYEFPWAKYAQTIIQDFMFGGMENTSATTETDTTIHDARAHLDITSDGLVAHELAHQWWGDLLTCRDWSHVWLNEGFATYFNALYIEHDKGEDEFAYEMRRNFNAYMAAESRGRRRPIVYGKYVNPLDVFFDGHVYQKGALVLNMLRFVLGDELFWKAMNHYAHTYAFKNVETNDLKRAIEEATGQNLWWFFDEWVYKAGYPEFEVGYHYDERAKQLTLTVKQTQQVDDLTPLFKMPVEVELVTPSGKQLQRIWLERAEQEFVFPLKERPLAVVFDKGNRIVKRLKFERSKQELRYLAEHDAVIGRINALADLVAAYKDDPITGSTLRQALLTDPFWGVRAEAAELLGQVGGEASLRALKEGYRDQRSAVRRAVVSALGQFPAGSVLDLLKQAFDHDPSYFVAAEALRAVARTKAEGAYEFLLQGLKRDSYQDVIRAAVFDGLSLLGDRRGLTLAMKYAAYGNPTSVRQAAISAVGTLGKGDAKAFQLLIELLKDPIIKIRVADMNVLGKLGDPKALPPLNRALRREAHAIPQKAARDAIEQIQQMLKKTERKKAA